MLCGLWGCCNPPPVQEHLRSLTIHMEPDQWLKWLWPGRMLESKLQEAKNKKDTLKARAKSANSAKQINDMVQGLNMNNAMTAFERMEEKVMALESESQAIGQVGPCCSRPCCLCAAHGGGHVRSAAACSTSPAVLARLCQDSATCLPVLHNFSTAEQHEPLCSYQRQTTWKASSGTWRATMWTMSWLP